MVGGKPSGTITFLFTDIEGSTKLWEHYPQAMQTGLAEHDRLLHEVLERHQGYIFKTVGDAFCAAFDNPQAASTAAIEAQLALHKAPWQYLLAPQLLKVRMALHTGSAQERDNDYFGPTLNRLARLLSLAYGGQILLSETTADLLKDNLPPATSLYDLGQCYLKDLPHPQKLFQLVAPGLPSAFPPLPLQAEETPPTNLPLALTSFVGRQHHLSGITGKLKGQAEGESPKPGRLVTLTGVGGVGKTRLALEVGRSLLTDYPEGVWLVELAALNDPALIVKKLAQVLGVLEISGRSLTEIVKDYLRPKKILLILDNCEHLLFECANLVEALLQRCSRLQILVTSRERLNITGEILWQVPPLSLPHQPSSVTSALAQTQLAASELNHSEATQLFIERVRDLQPNFNPNSSRLRLIDQICRQLDGLPLAIELAAARANLLGLEQLASRLDNRFRLLVGGSRTALPRQQTLRALIDWSYELLAEPEGLLFRRLAVFAGSWTLEAAEAVCSGAGLESYEVVDYLSQLINKSLLNVVGTGEATVQARYQMLETIREYAYEKLVQSGEVFNLSKRHLDWYANLAEVAAEQLWEGQEQVRYLDQLEQEYTDLRRALEWASSNQPESAARLVSDLTIFWDAHGYLSEGRRWQQVVLDKLEKLELPIQARLWFMTGWLAHRQNDFKYAEECCTTSLFYYQQLGDQLGSLRARLNLGWIALAQAQNEKALPLLEESLELAEQVGDTYCQAAALAFLGLEALSRWDYTRAGPLCEQSVALCRQSGHSQYLGWALTGLGAVKLFEAELEAAQALFEESLAELEAVGDATISSYNLLGLGVVALLQERPVEGVRLFGMAEAGREAIGTSLLPVFQPAYELAVIFAATQLEEATLNQAWQEGRNLTLAQIVKGRPTIKLVEQSRPAVNADIIEQLPEPERSAPELATTTPVPVPTTASDFELTPREQEVLRLLAAGLTNAQIAHELKLSSHTINGYLKTLYSKLGVNSRSAATRLALEQHLV